MTKKIKTVAAGCAAVLLAAAMPVSVNAADEATVNDTVNIEVGDTFTYSMYLSDTTKDLMGMQAYVFYDTDNLEIDTESISFETLNGVIYNGNLDGYMTFNFSNFSNPVDFSSCAQLISINFKVKKSGNTNIRYFIKEMYDSDMVSLTSYTLTCDISIDGEKLITDQTPIVESSKEYIDAYQGHFINYIDGKGNDNTDEKTDHKSIIGERTTVVPENADNQPVKAEESKFGTSINTFVIIIGCVLLACAIAGVIYFRHKEIKKNGLNSDISNLNQENSENDDKY